MTLEVVANYIYTLHWIIDLYIIIVLHMYMYVLVHVADWSYLCCFVVFSLFFPHCLTQMTGCIGKRHPLTVNRNLLMTMKMNGHTLKGKVRHHSSLYLSSFSLSLSLSLSTPLFPSLPCWLQQRKTKKIKMGRSVRQVEERVGVVLAVPLNTHALRRQLPVLVHLTSYLSKWVVIA